MRNKIAKYVVNLKIKMTRRVSTPMLLQKLHVKCHFFFFTTCIRNKVIEEVSSSGLVQVNEILIEKTEYVK